MLDITPPDYKFCPFCGSRLEIKQENVERRYCPEDNWTYYPRVATSCTAVIIKGSKVLMVKRNRDPYKGTWMFPAGFTEYGEHPDEAVKRETVEETGLNPISVKLLKIMQALDDTREPGHFSFIYKVEVGDGDIKTDKEENQDIGWFDINNLPKIGWIAHKEIARDLEKNLF